jgi:hypothetical protein
MKFVVSVVLGGQTHYVQHEITEGEFELPLDDFMERIAKPACAHLQEIVMRKKEEFVRTTA